jgi:hypothetical protein
MELKYVPPEALDGVVAWNDWATKSSVGPSKNDERSIAFLFNIVGFRVQTVPKLKSFQQLNNHKISVTPAFLALNKSLNKSCVFSKPTRRAQLPFKP